MQLRVPTYRRGMTLPELLVVIAIMGLLAVAVAPLFEGAKGKRGLSVAADLVIAHLDNAAAKAIGSRDGGGAWLETDAFGAGGDQAVASLLFARPRLATSGTAQITAVNLLATPPAQLSIGTSPFPAAIEPLIPGARISFRGVPATYRIFEMTTGTTASFGMLPNYSIENSSFPPVGATLPFSIDLPPRRKASASVQLLTGDACIDFSASTIGVAGFTPPSKVRPLALSKILAVVFDGVGRATTAWIASDHAASASASWERIDLDATRPIALLVGNRSQLGQAYLKQTTEDAPGPNHQNPDSIWVVIDPRTAVIRSVENVPAPTVQAAQAVVATALANQVRTF